MPSFLTLRNGIIRSCIMPVNFSVPKRNIPGRICSYGAPGETKIWTSLPVTRNSGCDISLSQVFLILETPLSVKPTNSILRFFMFLLPYLLSFHPSCLSLFICFIYDILNFYLSGNFFICLLSHTNMSSLAYLLLSPCLLSSFIFPYLFIYLFPFLYIILLVFPYFLFLLSSFMSFLIYIFPNIYMFIYLFMSPCFYRHLFLSSITYLLLHFFPHLFIYFPFFISSFLSFLIYLFLSFLFFFIILHVIPYLPTPFCAACTCLFSSNQFLLSTHFCHSPPTPRAVHVHTHSHSRPPSSCQTPQVTAEVLRCVSVMGLRKSQARPTGNKIRLKSHAAVPRDALLVASEGRWGRAGVSQVSPRCRNVFFPNLFFLFLANLQSTLQIEQ
jgi:hypothetical protein